MVTIKPTKVFKMPRVCRVWDPSFPLHTPSPPSPIDGQAVVVYCDMQQAGEPVEAATPATPATPLLPLCYPCYLCYPATPATPATPLLPLLW